MANAENPYDLDERGKRTSQNGRKSGVLALSKSSLTPDEQRKRLEGYVRVLKHLWPSAKYNKHVRYTETADKSGEFRVGGFVAVNPLVFTPKGSKVEKTFIKLKNGFKPKAPNYREWIVAYEDIEYLYAKGDVVAQTLENDIKVTTHQLNENIQTLLKYDKKLETRVSVLEDRK